MSRTTRRHKGKDRYRKWGPDYTREEFEALKAEYESLEWRVEYFCQWRYEYRVRKWYHHEVAHFRDYDHYLADYDAREHADGRRWGSGVPSRFVNTYCERPLRRQHKQQIHRAAQADGWDALLLEPFVHDAGWLYW